MNMQNLFGTALIGVFLAGCAPSMTQATATESEICRQWGQALPTRSRSDTEQTKLLIQSGYARFSLACPSWIHLVPSHLPTLAQAQVN